MKRLFPIICVFSCLIAAHTFAGSATWNLNPTSGDWNTAANWTPATVPDGGTDLATFALSNSTAISLSVSVEAALVFESGASSYTITVPSGQVLTISFGMTNNSGVVQEFVADKGSGAGGVIQFNNGAAGNLTHFDLLGTDSVATASSRVDFFNTSNAGTATFDAEPSEVPHTDAGHVAFHDSASASSATILLHSNSAAQGTPADLSFFDSSSAGAATVTCDGGKVRNGAGGAVLFNTTTHAGTSVITANGGQVTGALSGFIEFITSSSADSATLIANGGVGDGGTIRFFTNTTGGTSKIMLFGNGNLDISGLSSSGLTIGSIEGDGPAFLGSKNLSVGSNNLDTVYAGTIQDGGAGSGTGGAVTKVGTGILTLRGASSYTGLTTVSAGSLVVANHNGSATGTGAVKVNTGRIGGNGTITGGLTIGTGAGSGATLIPRLISKPTVVFTVNGALTFNSDATYNDSFNSVQNTADSVRANGVTISGARVLLKDRRTSTLAVGTIFTLINNTAATPTVGTFSNLADGATVTIGSNNYQVSYSGGDGNDLTLTVVP